MIPEASPGRDSRGGAPLSRRRAVRALAAGALGALAGRTLAPAPAGAVAQVVARCPGAGQSPAPSTHSGGTRYAATFVPDRDGKLSAVSITVSHGWEPEAGYVVSVVATDANGVPKTGRPLAQKTIPYEQVSGGFTKLTARFRKKQAVTLRQGRRYAVVVAREKGTTPDSFSVRGLQDNPCPDSTGFVYRPDTGYFPSATMDFEFEVILGYGEPAA